MIRKCIQRHTQNQFRKNLLCDWNNTAFEKPFLKFVYFINMPVTISNFLTGMISRSFRGFYNLQEVECFGDNVDAGLTLTSLRLVKLPEKEIIAVLRTDTKTCLTYNDYSSCTIDSQSTRRSRLRVLVYDLKEGESREYGCTANTVDSLGGAVPKNWNIVISLRCEYIHIALYHNLVTVCLYLMVYNSRFLCKYVVACQIGSIGYFWVSVCMCMCVCVFV